MGRQGNEEKEEDETGSGRFEKLVGEDVPARWLQ